MSVHGWAKIETLKLPNRVWLDSNFFEFNLDHRNLIYWSQRRGNLLIDIILACTRVTSHTFQRVLELNTGYSLSWNVLLSYLFFQPFQRDKHLYKQKKITLPNNLPGILNHLYLQGWVLGTVTSKTNEDYIVSSRDYDPMNKLTPAFHASLLLLIMNLVITLSK